MIVVSSDASYESVSHRHRQVMRPRRQPRRQSSGEARKHIWRTCTRREACVTAEKSVAYIVELDAIWVELERPENPEPEAAQRATLLPGINETPAQG